MDCGYERDCKHNLIMSSTETPDVDDNATIDSRDEVVTTNVVKKPKKVIVRREPSKRIAAARAFKHVMVTPGKKS